MAAMHSAAMNSGTITERLSFGSYVAPSQGHSKARHQTWRPTTALIGRIFLAAIFFISGTAKIADNPGTVAHMQDAGIPFAGTLVWIAAFAELLGAASIATGLLSRIGAIGLILFLVPTSYFFHPFWTLSGAEMVPQMANFMKNVAIAGGLAMIAAHGPGRFSLDHKLHSTLHHRGG